MNYADAEAARDEILAEYGIIFTEREESFDDLVHITAASLGTPVAFFALISSDTHWIKAGCGVGQVSTPRSETMCNTAVEEGEPVISPNASRDPRFADHPGVTGPTHIRGVIIHPVLGYGGIVIGTLCVFDAKPRDWTEKEVDLVRRIAGQIEIRLENRRKFRALRTVPIGDAEKRALIATLTAEQRVINRRIIHDVRNGIATISANAAVLEITSDPMERREIISDVKEACEKVMEVVSDLETFASVHRDVADRLEQDTDADFAV